MLERGGTQGILLIVMIILARLLQPNDFGLLVMVGIFVTIAGLFAESGFTTALIQKRKVDEIDYSSVFYLNLLIASILYVVLFFSAPLIAEFLEQQKLVEILRILSLTLFLGVFNSIQNAVIGRNLQFKKLFHSSLYAVFVSAVVGITMAYANFGVWALVGQLLTQRLLVTVFLWYTLKWRPRLLFSVKRIKKLYIFSWKILVSQLIDNLFINLQNILIGKLFSPSLLGFYNRGEQLPSFLVNNVNGSIQSVLLPALASHQDNIFRVKEMVRRSIVTSSFIIFPMMVGLAVIAEPLVGLLLTDKWLPAVPFLQIFCAVYALWPIHTVNLQAINALGRSDIFLKLEIIKSIIGLVILVISLQFGIYMMAFGVFVSGVISAFINAYPNLKLLNYSIQEQLKDLIPSLLLSLIMGMIVFPIQWLGMASILTIIIQISVGIVLYVALAWLFKLECFTYLVLTMKDMLRHHKKAEIILKNEVS
ncbi:lipopolysaccharide biosynthesis protein [Solibacillus silvestris]